MANRERLIELGWRQGVLLVPNDERFTENSHYEVPDDARLLVVSQTCDLVQGSFDREPYFEVLCIHPLGQAPKSKYLAGKKIAVGLNSRLRPRLAVPAIGMLFRMSGIS